MGCTPAPPTDDPLPSLEDTRRGLEPFIENVKQWPDSIKLYEDLVDTLANRGLFIEAARWCDSAIQRQPEAFAGWLLAKGDLYRMGKGYDSAIQAYRQYLGVFPDDEQILLNLANTYAEKGDPLALEICDQLNEAYPTQEIKANTAYIAGIYFSVAGSPSMAREWFDKAIAQRYTFTEAWMERGYSFYDEKMYKEAEQNFLQLIRVNKSNAEAWYWLGKSAEALGKKEKALEYYARAYSLDRSLTEARRAIERSKKK
ncbi:MAG TPA: tetratricopeptide repeat protein [Phnomibacter sp.]|nr:tetratricopeptide repeat protein [Phnomibacter sp.]